MKKSIFILMSVLCLHAPIRAQVQPQSAINNEIKQMEKSLLSLINHERAKLGLSHLIPSTLLANIAKAHSEDMAQGRVPFGHEGFDKRTEALKKYEQHTSFGENVAYFHHVEQPLVAAVNGWMKSKPHRENILGDYHETGVGIAYDRKGKCYITQVFSKKISR